MHALSKRTWMFVGVLFAASVMIAFVAGCNDANGADGSDVNDIVAVARQMIEEGRQTFRFETFGDEDFWGDQLRLHDAVKGSALGGVGTGMSPTVALSLGLKIDSNTLSAATRDAIVNGTADLGNPATTVELLRQHSVVGVTGFFDGSGNLIKMGIQCALCHSTVDDSLTVGIGRRRDGWANRDLTIGAIVALAPDLTPFTTLLGTSDATVRSVLNSWGPGKFDAELVLDGQAMKPGGGSAATLIPPAFGLAGVNLHTWTGWGSVTHWNGFVANIEMHGKGRFFDPRLNDAARFPIAAQAGFGNITTKPDLITPKLASLHYYQLSLKAPTPPSGSFDAAAAHEGDLLFDGQAQCTRCHVDPLF